jgi:hypothetical protein
MTPTGLSRARAVFAGGVLLLPWLAAADSQPQGGLGAKTTLRASAHLDFRIVIPRMLALRVDGAHLAPAPANATAASPTAANPAAGRSAADAAAAISPTTDASEPPQTVAVYGNGRTIALGATAADDSPSGLILSAAARKAIAQDAVCAPAPVRGTVRSIVCTASSP